MKTDRFAVITGDVIKSSKLTAGELSRLPAVFVQVVNEVDRICKQPAGTTKYSIFRGDSFQIITPPACALKTLIILRAELRKTYPKTVANAVDVRTAVAIGTVSHFADNITESTGEAFTKSGHLLDKLPHSRQTIFGSAIPETDKELNTSLSLADEIIRKWTSSQTSLISYLLSGLTQQEIALKTGSTQPTILRKVKSLGWQGISDLLIRYDEIIQI